MFLGHFAVAFAAKPLVPRASLALLIVAAQLADVLWPIFVALGLEEVRIAPGDTAFTPLEFVSYPYSHSLMMVIVWGALLGVITALLGSILIAAWAWWIDRGRLARRRY
jgi:hypothetical protein